MKLKVDKGKLVAVIDDPDEDVRLQLVQRIVNEIGTAHPKEDRPEVSCALSIANIRKLKAMGADGASDEFSRDVFKKMRAELDEYETEISIGQAVKSGGQPPVDYKFKLPPFKHQVLGWQYMHAMKTPALFGDCGTGKTFIAATFIDSLLKRGEKWVALVVCPVNLIKHVWEADIAKFTDLTCTGLREEHSKPAERERRRLARFAKDVDVYIVNPESLRPQKTKEKLVHNLLKRKIKEGAKIILVIDESSRMKTRTSATFKAVKRIRAYAERCIIMTGTPSPNGVLDLWPQFSILDDGMTLQPSFTDFRHDTCHRIQLKGMTWLDPRTKQKRTMEKWSPKKGMGIQVYRKIEPRMIRFRTEDCIDLPPKRFIQRDIEMTSEQHQIYDDMETALFAELEGGDSVTARVAATKLMKLREITGGFVISDLGQETQIGKTTPKMEELDELLAQSVAPRMGDSEAPIKAIIWANYRWECNTLVARYKKQYGARGLFGGISTARRDEAIDLFHSDPDTRLLVCHPASAGHGLTLVEANYVFYYSLSYNFEEFYQSFRRVTRPGQTRPMTFYFLVCPGTIDGELLECIRQKKDFSDLITDGKFRREDFLVHRGKDKQAEFNVSWEVPHDHGSGLPPSSGAP
jgi:SNF2 family DNA or RNA helicase